MTQSRQAGIKGLTFHDLRGSAVVRLALANATVPQIATFTGHALKDVEAILDKHYLGRDVRLAENAAEHPSVMDVVQFRRLAALADLSVRATGGAAVLGTGRLLLSILLRKPGL